MRPKRVRTRVLKAESSSKVAHVSFDDFVIVKSSLITILNWLLDFTSHRYDRGMTHSRVELTSAFFIDSRLPSCARRNQHIGLMDISVPETAGTIQRAVSNLHNLTLGCFSSMADYRLMPDYRARRFCPQSSARKKATRQKKNTTQRMISLTYFLLLSTSSLVELENPKPISSISQILLLKWKFPLAFALSVDSLW